VIPELVAAAVRLADILAAENSALISLELSRAASMLADKQRATEAFDAAMLLAAKLAGQAAPKTGAEPLAARLRELSEQNRRLLEHAISVQRELIATVVRALPGAAVHRYGRSPATANACPPALALAARA
jgi:hypothetical protein